MQSHNDQKRPIRAFDALPEVTAKLDDRRRMFAEIRPGLLAQILENVDQNLALSKRRDLSRKERYLALGRAHGLVDAMEASGLLRGEELINWIGYLEGCTQRAELINNYQKEEDQEIEEYLRECAAARNNPKPDGNDEIIDNAQSYDDDIPF